MRRSNRSADSSVWREFRVTGKVEVFPVDNPRIYVNVPQEHTEATRHLAECWICWISRPLEHTFAGAESSEMALIGVLRSGR
jgi:hypothetical protein